MRLLIYMETSRQHLSKATIFVVYVCPRKTCFGETRFGISSQGVCYLDYTESLVYRTHTAECMKVHQTGIFRTSHQFVYTVRARVFRSSPGYQYCCPGPSATAASAWMVDGNYLFTYDMYIRVGSGKLLLSGTFFSPDASSALLAHGAQGLRRCVRLLIVGVGHVRVHFLFEQDRWKNRPSASCPPTQKRRHAGVAIGELGWRESERRSGLAAGAWYTGP